MQCVDLQSAYSSSDRGGLALLALKVLIENSDQCFLRSKLMGYNAFCKVCDSITVICFQPEAPPQRKAAAFTFSTLGNQALYRSKNLFIETRGHDGEIEAFPNT